MWGVHRLRTPHNEGPGSSSEEAGVIPIMGGNLSLLEGEYWMGKGYKCGYMVEIEGIE